MQGSASSKIIWLVVAVIVAAGGVFLYYRMQKGADMYPSARDRQAEPSDAPSAAGTAEIEAELQGMDLDGLDAEMSDMEKEVSQ